MENSFRLSADLLHQKEFIFQYTLSTLQELVDSFKLGNIKVLGYSYYLGLDQYELSVKGDDVPSGKLNLMSQLNEQGEYSINWNSKEGLPDNGDI